MNTVYNYYTRAAAFEGSPTECWDWLMSQAFTMDDGRKIYRSWVEDGNNVYDVGSLYIYNE